MEATENLSKCRLCGRTIDLDLGAFAPADAPGGDGTPDDPIAPGDHNDICAICDYGD